MITTAHKDTDSEHHTDIQINNKDIKLKLQVRRTHSNVGFNY